MAILAIILPTSAQEKWIECRIVIDIPFHLSGGSEKDICYDIDSVALVKSLQDLTYINNDKNTVIKGVEFYSSVSPEGSFSYNKKLGQKRLKTAERIVRRYLEIPDSVPVTHTERLIPWYEYLLPAIEADSSHVHREDLMRIINESPRKNRRAALRRALGGKLWKSVHTYHAKHMRKGGAIIIVDRVTYDDLMDASVTPAQLSRKSSVNFADLDFSGIQQMKIESDSLAQAQTNVNEFSHGLHLKTNLVAWGLAITNVAIEADITKHLSIAVPVMYSAYNYFTPTVKFRTFSIQPEIRYWIKENNEGFFAGAHFGLAYYNVAVNGIKRYQDHDGKSPALGGGISIGYRLPLSKKHPNWKVEFTVGAGAYRLHYDTFYNVENGRLIGTHKKTYWGVDNAAINISYRFDLNKRKK